MITLFNFPIGILLRLLSGLIKNMFRYTGPVQGTKRSLLL